MGLSDPSMQRILMGIAHALFMNRLHLLRLTEIVRLRVQPDEDAFMVLPPEVDNELRQQAVDYVLTCFPKEWAPLISQETDNWLQPA